MAKAKQGGIKIDVSRQILLGSLCGTDEVLFSGTGVDDTLNAFLDDNQDAIAALIVDFVSENWGQE